LAILHGNSVKIGFWLWGIHFEFTFTLGLL